MLTSERDIPFIGFGAMLVEGFVAVMALIAATILVPGDYFAINSLLSFESLASIGFPVERIYELSQMVGTEVAGRPGGAVSLAVGMASIFSAIPGMKGLMPYWYNFALMFEAITSHHGTVNQMLGDGIMAIFGAPVYRDGHCAEAVRAALEMIALLEGFKQEQALRNKIRIQIGIGIATGKMIAGYTGTQHRATYTCVGDTVNLAKRIEEHTKVAGHSILIDQYTCEKLPADIQVESLGQVNYKGKQQPIQTFAIRLAAH